MSTRYPWELKKWVKESGRVYRSGRPGMSSWSQSVLPVPCHQHRLLSKLKTLPRLPEWQTKLTSINSFWVLFDFKTQG